MSDGNNLYMKTNQKNMTNANMPPTYPSAPSNMMNMEPSSPDPYTDNRPELGKYSRIFSLSV